MEKQRGNRDGRRKWIEEWRRISNDGGKKEERKDGSDNRRMIVGMKDIKDKQREE